MKMKNDGLYTVNLKIYLILLQITELYTNWLNTEFYIRKIAVMEFK